MDEPDATNQESDFFERIVFVKDINAEQVEFGPGLAGRINATNDVKMHQSGAFAVAAGQDAEVSFGGAVVIAVGRDLKQETGGGMVYAVGRDMRMTDSVAGISNVGGRLEMKDSLSMLSLSNSSRIEQSMIGVLFTNSADLGENNHVLLSTPQAAAFGAAFGLVFALLSWLFRKR